MRMSLISEKLQSSDWEHIQELLQDIRVQCGLLAGLVGVYLLRRALRTPKYNMPPGPWSLPLLGNLLSKYELIYSEPQTTSERKLVDVPNMTSQRSLRCGVANGSFNVT